MELIGELNGMQLVMPTSGGKAGKGRAKTISLQVRKDGMIVRAFRFNVADLNSRSRAVAKAKEFMQAGHVG